MRIILFTSELSEKNGWGRYSLELACVYKKFNHEVIVVCNKANNNEAIAQIELLPGPLSYYRNYFLFFLSVIKIVFWIKDGKETVVHCLVETYLPSAWLISKLYSCPLFFTVHGSFGLKPLAFRVVGSIHKKLYQLADKVICVSSYTKDRLITAVGNLGNIEVIPNGVNTTNTQLSSPRAGCGNGRQVLLGVGALKKRKGFHLVLRALPDILKIFPNLEYWIVGSRDDQDYYCKLLDIINENQIGERVKFFYNISDQELDFLYTQACLLVLTPISDQYNFEGFGLVYLEANLRGLPVVGSLENGGEEAIKDGKTGFLSRPNDPKDIARLIIKILSDQKLYSMMSEEATKWAQNHDWSFIAKRYLNLYKTKDEI